MKIAPRLYMPGKFTVGVDMHSPTPERIEWLHSKRVGLTTPQPFLWNRIQPTQHETDQDRVNDYAEFIDAYVNYGVPAYISVRGFPTLAQDPLRRLDMFPDFMWKLMEWYPEVTTWEIFNAVDKTMADEGFSGSWGDFCIYRVLLEKLQDHRANIDIAVSLLYGRGEGFNLSLYNYRSLFDRIHVKHMPMYYRNNWNIDDQIASLVSRLKYFITWRKPVLLSETGLMLPAGVESDVMFELAKCEWMERATEVAYNLGLMGIVFYSRDAHWRGTDIEHYPAEAALLRLCNKYNLPDGNPKMG